VGNFLHGKTHGACKDPEIVIDSLDLEHLVLLWGFGDRDWIGIIIGLELEFYCMDWIGIWLWNWLGN